MTDPITEGQVQSLQAATKWSPALNKLLQKLCEMRRYVEEDREALDEMAQEAADLCLEFAADCGTYGYETPDDAPEPGTLNPINGE